MPHALGRIARLAAWLGPWASEHGAPDVHVERTLLPGRAGRAPIPLWSYRPRGRRPTGAYLLMQGLHFAGPRDPRLDRFARVLAASGTQVFVPELPDYIAMRITPAVIDDARHLTRLVLAHPDRPRDAKLGIFTISFGSLPGLAVAGDPEFADEIGELVVFGGYRSHETAIRFCVTGRVNGEVVCSHDPLNVPALFLQVWDDLPELFDGADPAPVVAMWHRYIQRTWGRAHLKADRRWARLAERLADELESAQRTPFLTGCAVTGDPTRWIEQGLVVSDLDHLDPGPWLGGIQAPVTLLHGRDDDVIPHTESAALEAALRPHTRVRRYVTGIYGHTATESDLLEDLRAMTGELRTLGGMLAAIARAPTHPTR